jgi:hypothetical protein
MPGEDRGVAVMIHRERPQVHDMFYTVASGRIDQRFALDKHVDRVTIDQKNARDVFQCLIENPRIIEINIPRCPKLLREFFQIRFPSCPHREVCLPPF